jgi:CxxC-x17-CxxC domain-containing protein
VSFADKPLMCRECGREFSFTAGEQEFFAQKGFTNEPGRCPECRASRKARMGSSGGGMAYDSDRGYGGGSYGGGGGGGGYGRQPREMFSTICSECGQTAMVPFQPRTDKPVYCSSCFERVRSYR